MSENGVVLVCGAAGGTQGSTGSHLVPLLQARGAWVRALVHREDDRAKALRSRGIETVACDLLNPSAVRRAMQGVRRAYFAYPVRAGFVDAARIFAEAARRANLETVVSVSHLNAGPDALSPHTRRHGEVERLFDEAAIGAIHLRAAVFFENIRRQTRTGIASANVLQMPLGEASTKLPLIAGEDVARLAAGLLRNPEPYRGRPVFAIGEVLSARDLAGTFTNVLGRAVTYKAISDATWRAEASAREGEGADVQVEHLSAVWATMQWVANNAPDRFQPTPQIFQDLVGCPPLSFTGFVLRHAEEFAPAGAHQNVKGG